VDALKILKILEKKEITAAQLKDKVLPKRLIAVQDDFHDDKELSESLVKIKSILKKRWNSIYNQGKTPLDKPAAVTETKTEAVRHKIPYLGEDKEAY